MPAWFYLLGPYVLAGFLGAVWAFTEIVQTFASDLRRVFRTGWTWLFIGVNVAFTSLAYAIVQGVAGDVNPWWLALAAAAGGESLLRTQVNLFQPLHPAYPAAALLPFSALYSRFQDFCHFQIDQALISERMDLLEEAVQLPEKVLRQRMILRHQATMLHSSEELERFLERLEKHEDEHTRKILMASYLLQQAGGFDALRKWVKRQNA